MSPSADTSTGMFDVKISIDNADENLKVGMVSNVTLSDDTEDNSLLIPSKCVFKDGDASYVYVTNGNKLSKRSVTVSKNINDYLLITDGLTEDDEVVIQGSSNMTDNIEYNIVKSN